MDSSSYPTALNPVCTQSGKACADDTPTLTCNLHQHAWARGPDETLCCQCIIQQTGPSSVLLIHCAMMQRVQTQWPWQLWCQLSVSGSPLPSLTAQSGRRAALTDGARTNENDGCMCKQASRSRLLELKTVRVQLTQTNVISANTL